MLDDLHALVEFAQAGSIAGAADRPYLHDPPVKPNSSYNHSVSS